MVLIKFRSVKHQLYQKHPQKVDMKITDLQPVQSFKLTFVEHFASTLTGPGSFADLI